MKFSKMTFLFLFISQMLNANSWALSDADTETAILNVLSNRHPQTDEEAKFWKSLGSNAPGVILSLIKNSHKVYEKVRLIEALGWYDDTVALQFLKDIAQNDTNRIFRNAALSAIGASQGIGETEFISRFLTSNDPSTRITAAKTLDSFDDEESTDLVTDSLKKEKTNWISKKVRSHHKTEPEDPNLATRPKRSF